MEGDKTQVAENSPQTLEIVEEIKKSNLLNPAKDLSPNRPKESRLKIPKIGIEAPIIFPENNTKKGFQEALKKGVLFYPQSALPGEKGVTIILGYSAPPNWPKINYDWIFNDLYKLGPGDKIYVDFNSQQPLFLVTKKFFLQKSQELPSPLTNDEKLFLMLLNCWPPGKDQKRIVIEGELTS